MNVEFLAEGNPNIASVCLIPINNTFGRWLVPLASKRTRINVITCHTSSTSLEESVYLVLGNVCWWHVPVFDLFQGWI